MANFTQILNNVYHIGVLKKNNKVEIYVDIKNGWNQMKPIKYIDISDKCPNNLVIRHGSMHTNKDNSTFQWNF